MKPTSIFRAALIAVAVAISLNPSARAQSPVTQLRMHVPFAFECDSQQYPAGDYRLSRINHDAVMIRSEATQRGGMFLVNGVDDTAHDSVVIFSVYGSQHYLTQIHGLNGVQRATYFRSKAARKAQIASGNPVPSTVEIALNAASR